VTITRIALAGDQAASAMSQYCRQPTERRGTNPHPRRHRRRPTASYLLPDFRKRRHVRSELV